MMNSFFKPLGRKIGVLVLLLACVIAAAWVRSVYHNDQIEVGNWYLMSAGGKLSVLKRLVTLDGNTRVTSIQSVWSIYYANVAIPLTLISCWLLLSRFRGSF